MTFEEHIKNILGEETGDNIIKVINNEPFYSFRINQLKITKEKILKDYPHLIKNEFIDYAFYYNKNKDDLGKSYFHFGGAIYIQDSSAMMVSELLNPKEGERIIDLCAAPGGKATQSLIKMNDRGLLIANDISYKRAHAICENLERLGLKNAIVTNNQINELVNHFGGYFDKVILDAPCSGEGMFRKNNLVKDDWSMEKVNKLTIIQKELILQAYQLLKKDGIMVYSTCTFEIKENEEIINHLLKNTNASLINIENAKEFNRGINLEETIRLYPHHFKGEGHFIALIKCNDSHPINYKETKPKKINEMDLKIIKDFLRKHINYSFNNNFHQYNNLINYLPYGNINIDKLTVLRYGLPLGTLQTNRFEPSFALSMALPFINDYQIKNHEEYLKYLHGETLFNIENQSSYISISYNDIRIGFGKANQKQIKNLLPKGLRI